MNQEEEVYSAPFKYTLSIFSDKWKMTIMFWLSGRKILRYGELKKCIKGITHKMLSSHLKELETNDVIVRKEYHQVPPSHLDFQI